MFEHSEKFKGGDKAVIVSLETYDFELSDHDEFVELVKAADVDILKMITGKLATPNQRFFLGTGKVEEVKTIATSEEANVVIVNHELTPSQNKNLERELGIRVVDRTALILDIFAQRAESFEGKLQVELAQLTHISSRLVRMWTHLDSLRGGSVGLRGPGETQLESDRRMIGERIKQLKKKLEKVKKTRAQGQALRNRLGVPVIALVGYTNAGKSSLFNTLTNADTYVENKLFATLDPKHRSVEIEGIGKVVLIDTVGFISKLPHELVEAFHSTLQSAVDADLILEVSDVSDPDRNYKKQEVYAVLEEIGAENVPRLEVFNKIDLSEKIEPHIAYQDDGSVSGVWISAMKAEGIELLKEGIIQFFKQKQVNKTLYLPASASRLRAKLFKLNAIKNESFDEVGGSTIEICLDKIEWERMRKNDEDAKQYFI